jgi:NtrC-family two-component system sensor histidine kinase KinB
MSWALAVDAVVWVVTLGVSIALARLVYRRRDLPARLFAGMVAALIVVQVRYAAMMLGMLLDRLLPGVAGRRIVAFFETLWPLDIIALIAFGCLMLHLFLVFPAKSRIVRSWRWAPLLFYIPGVLLSMMMLSYLFLGAEGYMSFWGLDGLGLKDTGLQLAFVILVVGIALLRLLNIYLSQATSLVRQQLAWILWGLLLGGGLILLTDYFPMTLGLRAPVAYMPGLRQVPILIILGAFALSIYRFQFLDVHMVVNRGLVYSALTVVITALYFVLGTLMTSLVQSLSLGLGPTAVGILTTTIIVVVALPLRDAIQRQVDRMFQRSRVDYRHLLQDSSRVLTAPVSLSKVLVTVADRVEAVFHPSGLALVLADVSEGYKVKLSRGDLASHPPWVEGSTFSPDCFVPSQLAARKRPFYLPWHVYNVAADQREEWQQLQESGVQVFIPMVMGGTLYGWLALGPRTPELAYARQDLSFLSALMDQSCVALEKARLHSETQQQSTELALVAMVSSAISSSLDLEQVLETIVESVIQVMGCDKSAIFEVSEDGATLSLRMARGLSQAYVEYSRNLKAGEDNRALALETGELVITPDVLADERLAGLAEMARQEGYRAVVDIPLAGPEGPLGVLSVYFDHVHMPSLAELELLATFADQAAIAIQNARLYAAVTRERDRARRLYEQTDAALARRVEELTAIGEISQQLTSSLNRQQIMDLMLARAVQATQADRGFIALYDLEQGLLQALSDVGYPPTLEPYRSRPWPVEEGVTGRAARTGLTVLVPDVTEDPDYVSASPSTCSQLSVPMIHEQDGVLGVITLESDRHAAFREEHVRFVGLLAEYAVIAIHNARLFQQVREARDRLGAILNSTHDMVVVADTRGRITLTNRRFREVFGSQVDDWLQAFYLPDAIEILDGNAFPFLTVDMEGIKDVIRRIREYPGAEVDLAFNFEEAGRRRHVEGTASPMLSESGELMGWVAVMREVTERKELERFREDLTNMVIHNLQGPLAALISSLETLRGEAHLDSKMARELTSIALTSGHKLYTRIESLLWIRRLEERSMPLNLQPVPLWSVVQPVVDEYMSLARTVDVRLDVELAPDLPHVNVDEELIGRVFSNLLDNALKYVPEGGRIQVRASLDRSPDEPVVVCSVADNGPGISDSVKEVLFEKFRRGDPAPRGLRRGMGIGLHYCRVAVEAHKGRIWVDSQKGQGSTFYVALPASLDGEAQKRESR